MIAGPSTLDRVNNAITGRDGLQHPCRHRADRNKHCMRHYHTLYLHESDESVNERLRKMIIAHADLSTRGQRCDWYYECWHDHINVRFWAKADWRHFEETFEKENKEFLSQHGLLEPEDDSGLDSDTSQV